MTVAWKTTRQIISLKSRHQVSKSVISSNADAACGCGFDLKMPLKKFFNSAKASS